MPLPRLDNSQNNLYEPRGRLRERQGRSGPVFESSVYTLATMYTKTTLIVFGAIGLIVLAVLYRKELSRRAPALRQRLPTLPLQHTRSTLRKLRTQLPDLRQHLPSFR